MKTTGLTVEISKLFETDKANKEVEGFVSKSVTSTYNFDVKRVQFQLKFYDYVIDFNYHDPSSTVFDFVGCLMKVTINNGISDCIFIYKGIDKGLSVREIIKFFYIQLNELSNKPLDAKQKTLKRSLFDALLLNEKSFMEMLKNIENNVRQLYLFDSYGENE